MIYVRIELWPHGFESEAKVLGRAYIANDGTGTEKRGNYDVILLGKTNKHAKRLKVGDFPRKSHTAWKLLYLALKQVFEEKK